MIVFMTGVTPLAIEGSGRVARVVWRDTKSNRHETACDAVGIGFGLRSETQLADLAVPVGDGIWEIAVGRPLPPTARARVQVSVKDRQGNITRVDRRFSVKR